MSCGPHLRHCRQRGAGLVEVAIALLVLAIGALGLGSLQIAAKRMGFEAIQRTEAAALASDLLARLRANPLALPAYASTGIGEASGAQLPPPGADCDRGGCAPAAWAAWDLWQWQQALDGVATGGGAGGLVRPTGCVRVNGRQVVVEIAWQGFRPLSAPPGEAACGAGSYGPADADRQWLRMGTWIGAQ
ncbi:MAG: type IV pilus modification protein PilV [Halioglobus sp.]|nr:type IV pilus modification protein PilV [Halioglobus sp.]